MLRYLALALFAFAAYLLGAKAGRGRYRHIVKTMSTYWNDPKTKKARAAATKARQRAEKSAAKKYRRFRRSTH